MKVYINPARFEWPELFSRVAKCGVSEELEARVAQIIERVRKNGDAAIKDLAFEIDKVRLDSLKVSEVEFAEAETSVSPAVKQAVTTAFGNILAFHKAQMPERIEVETAPGVRCIRKPVPVPRVGMYIPGGTAPLFSTVLMLGVPSMVAGCPVRVLCTPAGRDGRVNAEVLWTARLCGISDVYKVGGAQAIAAMAYGTESIAKVDKIFGPGNSYVTTAKQMVSVSAAAIDMPAGPSEVMVLADSAANPAFVASDLLSQAEHGRDSQAMLVCTDASFADAVIAEVERQAAMLPRGEFIGSSLSGSRAIVFDSVDDMLDFADGYAPEHLIIAMRNADEIAERVTCAGSVFIGNYSPESAGDYASGTNHTLPTSGWARSYSGVGLDSFLKQMTLQKLSAPGLAGLSGTIISMAEAEGLEAHANAVRVRMEGAAAAGQEKSFNLESIVRPNILNLTPYSTARDEYNGILGVFLDANENPFQNGYNRYPDPHQKDLKAKISGLKGIPVPNLFIGNGSDEAIDLVFRVFCVPGRDNVVSIEPSYGMYKVAAATNDIECRPFVLGDDFSLDAKALLAATDSRTKAIFICSPNNPSGNAFEPELIKDVARAFRGVVVVDEAYGDFCSKQSVALTEPNIIVLQTLSKAWGLASLRLGLAIASEEIVRLMSMVKYPYNISKAAMEVAMKELDRPVEDEVGIILSERARVAAALPSVRCVRKVWPSEANFILVQVEDANLAYDLLVAQGIIVRNRTNVTGCKGCLRITIGTPEENDKMLHILSQI